MAGSQSRSRAARLPRKARHALEYHSFTGIVWLLRHLPPATSCALASTLGLVWYALDVRHRRIALSNLRTAFGQDKTGSEIERIALASFRNTCLTFAEFCHLADMHRAGVRSMVETVDYENFLRAKAKNQGVLLFTAHLGNWELMGLFQSAREIPINVLGRPLDNALLNETLDRVRTRFGNRVIPKQRAAREMMRLLRNGEVIGVLMDQNTIASAGVFVDFFGKSACTTPVVALMAERLNVPAVPAFTYRIRRGKHVVVVGKEVPLERTGDRRRDLVANTAKLTKIIESHIRAYPDQWLWMHNRWKTQPENPYARRTDGPARRPAGETAGMTSAGGTMPPL